MMEPDNVQCCKRTYICNFCHTEKSMNRAERCVKCRKQGCRACVRPATNVKYGRMCDYCAATQEPPPLPVPLQTSPVLDLNDPRYRKFLKQVLLERDRGCIWCKKKLKMANMTLDHLIPVIKGGSDVIHNLAACCVSCNEAKANRLPLNFILLRLEDHELRRT